MKYGIIVGFMLDWATNNIHVFHVLCELLPVISMYSVYFLTYKAKMFLVLSPIIPALFSLQEAPIIPKIMLAY